MAESLDFWRECASWLTRVGVIRKDHKTNWPNATITDLAITLRDGVLICHLLHKLDPNCIDMREVNQKPQLAQFLCTKNIRVFLRTLISHFYFKEGDLFETSMLFNFGDFSRVLHTLAKLSTCPKVQKLHKYIPGFYSQLQEKDTEDQIYKNLNDELVIPQRRPVEHEYEHYNIISEIQHEAIYQDLVVSSKIPSNCHKRDYVINELLETERNYIDVLKKIIKCFMEPLQGVFKEEDFKIIFLGIKDFYRIHQIFHSELEGANLQGSTFRLSDVFINSKDDFVTYSDYCNNLPACQEKMNELAKIETYNVELIRCEKEANNNKFKLQDILYVPMQRILKYPLLLQSLLAETPKNHVEYLGIIEALDAMKDVSEYLNEAKKDFEKMDIIRRFENNIIDLPKKMPGGLKDCGRLVYDGVLKMKSSISPKGANKVDYIFIFEQIMIMCKIKGEFYDFKEKLHLREYIFDDSNTKPKDYSWSLVSKSGTAPNYTFYAKTQVDKDKAVKEIKNVLANFEVESKRDMGHKFEYKTFKKVSVCLICNKYMRGLIYQGYRCEECGFIVHKQCIHKIPKCGTTIPAPVTRSPRLSEFLWFVGNMDRIKATSLLERETHGTYLLRIRSQTQKNETMYALSVKCEGKVQHMKIMGKIIDGALQYYLSDSRYFKSVVDLIAFYERNNLREIFKHLNTNLQWPYRKIEAIAEFDFLPTESNQLPLTKGCQVIVLSKEGEQKGWWKGKIDDRIGFFPKVYVREKYVNGTLLHRRSH